MKIEFKKADLVPTMAKVGAFIGSLAEQKDYVLMRGHESPDYYVELLNECRGKVNQLLEERENLKVVPARKKPDKNIGEQPQIPGQIDIFSFLAS